MTKSLDVGCGAKRRASVRLDVVRTKETNILGFTHCLPFRDKVFTVVFCFHVLEHVNFPKKALKELCRVGELIKIKLPFLFYHHKRKFDFRCLNLKWRFGLDRERKRRGIPFRIEVPTIIRRVENENLP